MNRATKNLQFKFKVTSVKDVSGECVIEGYANTSSKDRVGDVVLPDAFAKSLPTYQKNPVVLLNHDWNNVIGRSIHQEITDKGLFIKAKISNTRQDIKTLINEGCYSTFSIGYNEIDSDYDDSTKTKYIKELELLEISIVSVPANTEAMFTQITEKTDTESTEEKGKEEKEKKAKKVGDLKVLISDIKSVVGKELDEQTLHAAIDYFNSNEEIMTKEQMIKLLNVKNASAAVTEEKAKDEAAQPAAAADGQHGDAMKELAAKLDVIAQALGQLMEKIDQLGKEEASEEQDEEAPAKDEEEKKEDPKKDDESKEDDAKKDEEEKDCADKEEMDKEEGEEDEKELSLDDINSTIAALTQQISALDEEVNG